MLNGYLAYLMADTTHDALVLDSEHMGTSTALAGVMTPTRIVAFGTDAGIPKAAQQIGVCAICGWSGKILHQLRDNTFSLIYLDYCGTHEGSDAFDPALDMRKATRMLCEDGVLAVTFCKRNSWKVVKFIAEFANRHSFFYQLYPYRNMVFAAFRSQPLPAISPPAGTIVQVNDARGNVVYGLVKKRLTDGAVLQEVVRRKRIGKQNHFVPGAAHALWEENDVDMRRVPHASLRFKKGEPTLIHGEGKNAWSAPWPANVVKGPFYVVKSGGDEYAVSQRAIGEVDLGVEVVVPDAVEGDCTGFVESGPLWAVKSTAENDDRIFHTKPHEMLRPSKKRKKK